MDIKINGVSVNFNGNPKLGRNAYEERDTGAIEIISARSTRYETYDTVDVTIGEDTEQYLVLADNVTSYLNKYKHNITLVENMAFFDTFFPADRAFKIQGQTLGDILNAYAREALQYHKITITYTTLTTAQLNTVIPYKEVITSV